MTRSRRPISSRGIATAAGLLALVTLLSRLVGVGRWLEFSHSVGVTCVGTVYQVTNSVPNVLFEVAAGGALAAVAVPLIGDAIGRDRQEEADRVGSALLTWTLSLLVPASVVLALLAGPISGLLVDDASCPGAHELAATMLRIFAPQVALYGLGIVLAGILQAHRHFLAAALTPLLSSLVVIATYAGYGHLVAGGSAPVGPSATIADVPQRATLLLAGGTTLGVVVLSLPLLVPALRLGIRLRPTYHFPPGAAGRMSGLAGAGLLALFAQQYAVLASIVVSNRSGTGVFTVQTYVQTVYLLPYAVLAVPLAISTFPALATMQGAAAGAGQRRARRDGVTRVDADAAPVLARSLRGIVVVGMLGAGVLVAVAAPLGHFFAALDAGRVNGVGRLVLAQLPLALLTIAPGLPALCVAALLTRALYVRGRPIIAGSAVAAGWLIAGSAPLALVPPGANPAWTLGVLGLASSAGMLIAVGELVAATIRAWGSGAVAGLGRSALVSLAGGILAAGTGLLVTRRWVTVGLWSSFAQGVVLAAVAVVLVLGVVALGDRPTARLVLVRLPRRRATPAPVEPQGADRS